MVYLYIFRPAPQEVTQNRGGRYPDQGQLRVFMNVHYCFPGQAHNPQTQPSFLDKRLRVIHPLSQECGDKDNSGQTKLRRTITRL